MYTQSVQIGQIPSLLWGEPANRVILAVHGNMSHKADTPIALLASHACPKGYQVLSFDLPEHGDRKGDGVLCKVQPCVEELNDVMAYAKTHWAQISLFGCSIGAFFSLMAYEHETFEQALFLSPVVDMRRIIENMMNWFQVSETRLAAEGEIPTPIGQPLYWDYYCFVKEHPVTHWNTPTSVLYGEADEVVPRDTIEDFTQRFSCNLDILKGSEHYFHRPEQLNALENWLETHL